MTETEIIAHTHKWIKSVVVGCNFCPFAAKAMLRKSIRYQVIPDATIENTLQKLVDELKYLEDHDEIETTLIILPDAFSDFEEYLDLVSGAGELNLQMGFEGVYQIASFHPDYLFAGTDEKDPANYTNRSLYPMLHILREESVTIAVENYPGAENIPERNIEFARQKGLDQMKSLRAACFE